MMISIMPTVNGRRRNDFHHVVEASNDLPDDALGEAVGDCLRNLQQDNIAVALGDMITLELRFA
jgi:hypothetical protein